MSPTRQRGTRPLAQREPSRSTRRRGELGIVQHDPWAQHEEARGGIGHRGAMVVVRHEARRGGARDA